jgi:hypothetical protein
MKDALEYAGIAPVPLAPILPRRWRVPGVVTPG